MSWHRGVGLSLARFPGLENYKITSNLFFYFFYFWLSSLFTKGQSQRPESSRIPDQLEKINWRVGSKVRPRIGEENTFIYKIQDTCTNGEVKTTFIPDQVL